MLVAVVKVTVTLADAVNGTAVDVVKPVTAAVLPIAPPVIALTLRKSLVVDTEKYWQGAVIIPPRVKPSMVTVYEPAFTAAVVVITTLVWPAAAMLAANPVLTFVMVGEAPETYPLG